jgi:hypothetical protein
MLAALLVASAILAGTPPALPATQSSARVNPDAALVQDFTKRVDAYMAVHKKAAESLPRLSREASPQEIDRHQRALASAVRKLRPRAQAGDVFTREIRAFIRRQIAAAFAGDEGRRLMASIMDENPGPIKVSVNGRYPDTVPLATMPPQVLALLPKLPAELEYRFIAERLILLDVPAHLIVDVIEGALPR